MAVPGGSLNSVRPTPTVFELEALEGLPCGCVAAAYRLVRGRGGRSLEAKGPHCIRLVNMNGQVLRLGDPSEFDEDEDTRSRPIPPVREADRLPPQIPSPLTTPFRANIPKTLIAYGKAVLVQSKVWERHEGQGRAARWL